jgi:hypothetical protein
MELNALAIALQGVGFGPLAMAAQGFLGAEEPTPPDVLPAIFWTPVSGSPGNQMTMRQLRRLRRRRREQEALAAGLLF